MVCPTGASASIRGASKLSLFGAVRDLLEVLLDPVGREKLYFAYFWNDLAADNNRSLKLADRNAYVAAYSRPGRMRAGWAYFAAWPETAKDFAEMAKTKLTMPVLSIAGEKASAAILSPQMKVVAANVNTIDLKDTGHGLMEERPEETMEALIAFL
jgi:pimeloyl-ACP methyl ester carboxylesterase